MGRIRDGEEANSMTNLPDKPEPDKDQRFDWPSTDSLARAYVALFGAVDRQRELLEAQAAQIALLESRLATVEHGLEQVEAEQERERLR